MFLEGIITFNMTYIVVCNTTSNIKQASSCNVKVVQWFKLQWDWSGKKYFCIENWILGFRGNPVRFDSLLPKCLYDQVDKKCIKKQQQCKPEMYWARLSSASPQCKLLNLAVGVETDRRAWRWGQSCSWGRPGATGIHYNPAVRLLGR